MKHRLSMSVGILVTAIVLLTIVELLMIRYNGARVPRPNIPRAPESYGSGPALTYVVLGDSTGVTQGGDYDKGIARTTARFIAAASERRVTLHNLAVSGARSGDVLRTQTAAAVKLKPDVVLVAVGANDVTHFVPARSTTRNLQAVIAELQAANPVVKIVLTGAPEMGSVPRFPQPIRYFAKLRTSQTNSALAGLGVDRRVVLAPIAAKTGPTFARRPELFAADKFHPTTDGYQTWMPVLEDALSSAMQ